MKARFAVLLVSSIFVGMSGLACADTFIDDFDDGPSNSHWSPQFGNWEYIAESTGGGYDYRGTGTPDAGSAANNGAKYYNNGLLISAVFQHTPSDVTIDHNEADVFFSLTNTGTGWDGYSVAVDYNDHTGDGNKDYALRIGTISSHHPNIGYQNLTGVDSNTIFQFDVSVGTTTFDVVLKNYTTQAILADIQNLSLVLGANFTGGMVGVHTWDTVTTKYYEATGDLMSAVPTPEPTTMLLFGTGIAGLAAVGRRCKK